MTDWHDSAACRGSHLFLSEAERDILKAQQVCTDCPVFEECQAFAAMVKPTVGVWAGRDYADHRKRGRRPIPTRSLRPHGPGSEPHSCQRPECREQHRAYSRAHEAKRRARSGTRGSVAGT